MTSPIIENKPSAPVDVTSPVITSANTAFPPPPNTLPPPLSSSPSRPGALSKALKLAARTLFGTGVSKAAYLTDRSPSRSPRRQALLLPRTLEGEVHPSEEELLRSLEDLAQKTDVLVRWADDMYESVKAIPQSTFIPSDLILDYGSHRFDSEPLPRPAPVPKTDNQPHRRRADVEAEFNALTCVELYLLIMAFSQKGIDQLRIYQDQTKMRDPYGNFEMSPGFDDGMFCSVLC